jgi:hypothetical protein
MATLIERLTDAMTLTGVQLKSLRTLINGNVVDLAGLTTTVKTHLVAAINEINAKASYNPQAAIRSEFYSILHCLSTVSNSEWSFIASGTGTSWAIVTPGGVNAVGVIRGALGTLATNRIALVGGPGTGNFTHRLGRGVSKFTSRRATATLSNATNTYTERLGFMDSLTGDPVDGAYWRYTHGVNSGKWQCVTRSNNVETAVDSGITNTAGTTSYNRLSVLVNATGTAAEYWFNDTLVQTITTNIPTAAGRETGWAHTVVRSTGTVAVNAIEVDYCEVKLEYSPSI